MEIKKPKLFISQPMQGKSIEEIFAEREEAAKKATSLVKRDMEVIDSYIQDAPEGAKPLWFLGKSLELMSDADVVYFAEGWQKARGCRCEYECARAYADDDFVCYEHGPRWIPCSERIPILHKEEFMGEMFYTSDTVMFSTADRVHVGFCVQYGKELIWEIQDGLACEDGVTAWMPMPEPYKTKTV